MNTKVAAETAAIEYRIRNAELDRIIAGMRRDADHLDAHGEYAGATMMRHNADRMERALGYVRDATVELVTPPA